MRTEGVEERAHREMIDLQTSIAELESGLQKKGRVGKRKEEEIFSGKGVPLSTLRPPTSSTILPQSYKYLTLFHCRVYYYTA